MNTQRTRKPAFLECLLTLRLLWSVVVASAALTSTSLTAQVRPMPDTNPGPPSQQVELPAEKPTPPIPPVEREVTPARQESEAAGGLQSLSLKLDYPTLEIAEDRAYIPLFFTILGDYQGTNDITVRAVTYAGW